MTIVRGIDNCLYNYSLPVLSEAKRKRYGHDDCQFQLESNINIFSRYVQCFKQMGVYSKYKNEVNSYMFNFLYGSNLVMVAGKCKMSSIVKINRSFLSTDTWKEIKNINTKNISHPLIKLTYFCFKFKAFRVLYFALKLKRLL